ncbi:MAG: nitroreductase family protein [Mycoplasmataceae bacterium]|nr:nitroreductase family protein [Mycoplasmataceae bacterium]
MKRKEKNMKNKSKEFIDILKTRHSNYTIINESTLNDKKMIHFIGECIKYNPSAFNIQSTRVVLLLHEQSKQMWEYVLENLSQPIPNIVLMELKSCVGAYATLLFYDDESVTINGANQYKMKEENFISWSLQANAMLQHSLWVGLSYLGYAVNIQHYNTLIDPEAKEKYDIPSHWKLIGQMSFGKFTKNANKHDHLPIDQQLTIEH